MSTTATHLHEPLMRFPDQLAQLWVGTREALKLSMQGGQKSVDYGVHQVGPFKICLPEHVLTEWLASSHTPGVV